MASGYGRVVVDAAAVDVADLADVQHRALVRAAVAVAVRVLRLVVVVALCGLDAFLIFVVVAFIAFLGVIMRRAKAPASAPELVEAGL